MNSAAIVAIVAMFLAFLVLLPPVPQPEAEVVLRIERPQVIYVVAPPLPDRNPRR